MSALDAAALVDALYRRAVESPHEIDDAALEEWMAEAAEAIAHDRTLIRPLRAAVRFGRKLAAYCTSRGSHFPDWSNGVDEALGTRGWEPQLDLVRHELESTPTADAFEAMKVRHRAVHFTEWMEGLSFDEWRAGSI